MMRTSKPAPVVTPGTPKLVWFRALKANPATHHTDARVAEDLIGEEACFEFRL